MEQTASDGEQIENTDLDEAPPIGILLLAILHLVGGFGIIAVLGGLLTNSDQLDESAAALEAAGFSPMHIAIGYTFIGLLGISSGIGMWRRQYWGWWLGALYHLHGFMRRAFGLWLVIVILSDSAAERNELLQVASSKQIPRMVISGIIFLLFFKASVLKAFGLESLNKRRAFGTFVGIYASVLVISTIIEFLVP